MLWVATSLTRFMMMMMMFPSDSDDVTLNTCVKCQNTAKYFTILHDL